MKKRTAVMIDGGHLRSLVQRREKSAYDPDYIEKIAHSCVVAADEDLPRVYYYDCAPYRRPKAPGQRRGERI